MIVSEGETIRLRVKFDPQEEETFNIQGKMLG